MSHLGGSQTAQGDCSTLVLSHLLTPRDDIMFYELDKISVHVPVKRLTHYLLEK